MAEEGVSDEYVAQFILAKGEAFVEFRRALSAESDRGCALFAAAFLENELLELIQRNLVPNANFSEDLVRSNGPLATFSSRIRLAYYLGGISPNIRRDLNLVRLIRNDFAHHPELITFEEPSIADRCRALSFTWQEGQVPPRDHFTAAVAAILSAINTGTFRAVPPTEAENLEISDHLRQKLREHVDEVMKAIHKDEGETSDGQ